MSQDRSEYKRAWAEANKERISANKRAYYQANKEKIKAKSKAYREANKERLATMCKAWYAANSNRVIEERKKYIKEYFSTEHGKTIRRIQLARRRSSQLQRTPYWLTEADFEKIKRKYVYAQRKTETTGEQWDVDHIIPLQGKFVSGLHVPANLRVIKHTTNCSKRNHFDLEKEWRVK